MLFKWSIEKIGVQGAAANERWVAFPPRQEITITRFGEYTKVVLTKPAADIPVAPRPAWA